MSFTNIIIITEILTTPSIPVYFIIIFKVKKHPKNKNNNLSTKVKFKNPGLQ